ncbi:MAG: hypothetical protein ACTS43_02475 [Candidatus Hodgkinia cicadicola]
MFGRFDSAAEVPFGGIKRTTFLNIKLVSLPRDAQTTCKFRTAEPPKPFRLVWALPPSRNDVSLPFVIYSSSFRFPRRQTAQSKLNALRPKVVRFRTDGPKSAVCSKANGIRSSEASDGEAHSPREEEESSVTPLRTFGKVPSADLLHRRSKALTWETSSPSFQI